MKKEDQQDATIRCLLLTSVSTCFGQHYAHLLENKGPVTAFGVLFWFCWLWLVVDDGRCLAGCDHCEGFCSTLFIINFRPTCFGHHYAHLQENKGPVTAFGVLFWFCWMWLVAVVGRCLAGCDHCEGFCSTLFIINFCLNMFRASLCPSSGEQRPCYCILCVLVLLDVVGSG